MISSKRLFELKTLQKRIGLLLDNNIGGKWSDEYRLTTKEAAAFLGISPNALRLRVYRQQIRTEKFGREFRFRLSDLLSSFNKFEV